MLCLSHQGLNRGLVSEAPSTHGQSRSHGMLECEKPTHFRNSYFKPVSCKCRYRRDPETVALCFAGDNESERRDTFKFDISANQRE